MTDNHNVNGEINEQIDQALADARAGKVGDDTLINALAQTQPQARPEFQDQLESQLLVKLDELTNPTPTDHPKKEKIIPMTESKRKKSKKRFSLRRLGWIAAVLALIILGAILVPRATNPCAFVRCTDVTRNDSQTHFSPSVFEATATQLVREATQTAQAPLLMTQQAQAAAQRDENCPQTLGWEGRHTVTFSDTIFSLAEIYSTSIEDIVRENCLTATDLIRGDELRVPFVDPADLRARTQEAVIEQLRLTEAALSATPTMTRTPAPVTLDPFTLTATAFVAKVTQTAEAPITQTAAALSSTNVDPFPLTATAMIEQSTAEAGR